MLAGEDDSTNRPYIKEIKLQDFMCHHNFEIKLSSGLNLIYGTNGSGKSAILTAIMIALGGKARSTSRSENLGGLVRTGCNNCWITIKFHVPYHITEIFSKYGREVTVVRKISAKGSSSYSLKDSTNHLISKAGLKEVQELCFYFGIYPENEMAMLSQEKAKEFLVHATSRAKYEKLERALQQQLIRANLEAVALMDEAQRSKIAEMKLREENAKLAEERAVEFLGRADMQNIRMRKIAHIKNILQWRQLDEPSAHLETLKGTLQSESLDLSNLEARTSNLEQMPVLQEEVSNLVDEINRLKVARTNLDNEISDVEAEIQSQNYTIRRMKEDMQVVNRDISENLAELNSLQDKLTNHSPEALDREIRRLKQERDDAGQRKLESEAEQAVIKQKIEENRATAEILRRKRLEIKHEIDEIRQTQRALDNERQELASGTARTKRKSPNERYHDHLKKLVASTSGWLGQPIGPLYETIELNDEGANYSPALERLWSSTLDSWWVQHDDDRKKLVDLAKRANFNSFKVILRKDEAFRFEDALPPESKEYYRAIDLLQVRSDAIRRILIDLNSIEKLVLVESIEAAFDAINNPKILSSIAVTRTQRGTTEYTMVAVSGSRQDSSRVMPSGFVRMKIGTKARQNQIRGEMKENLASISLLEERLRVEEESLSALDEECKSKSQKLAGQVDIAKAFTIEISNLSRKIVSLETDVNAQSCSNDIERIKPILDRRYNEYAGFQETLPIYEEALMVLEARKAEKMKLSEEHLRDQMVKKANLKDLEKQLRKIEADAAQAESRLRRKRERVNKLQEEVAQMDIRNFEYEQEIFNKVGPRLDANDESVAELRLMDDYQLTRELQLLETESEVAAASETELETARNEVLEAKRVRNEAERNRIMMESHSNDVRKRYMQRLENEDDAWKKLKDKIGNGFQKFLRGRNFSGKVMINDDKKTLQIEAAPEASSNRGISTLSGGEKSFTQIALLMSIWKAMSVGLVALDEYDVFMDKINRSFSLHLLAKTVDRGNMQCLIITPQDVDTTVLEESDSKYKLHKLIPAER